MRTFDELFEMAAARKGGAEAFEAELPKLASPKGLAAIPDHEWLETFSRGVFQTGLSWKMIETKWPGIRDALWDFDVGRCSMMSDEDLDALLQDKRVIRHAAKLLSVRDNAVFLRELSSEHGSAARFFADWPAEDFAGLLGVMKKRGARIGGNTGMYALRFMGRDGYVLGADVVTALIREGVIDKQPTSARAMAAVQAAFNTWAAQSGRPLAAISKTLACTVE
ncbi:MAG: DNA-3-methyladenine glycosylase I [Pseudomonadota bacterium]